MARRASSFHRATRRRWPPACSGSWPSRSCARVWAVPHGRGWSATSPGRRSQRASPHFTRHSLRVGSMQQAVGRPVVPCRLSPVACRLGDETMALVDVLIPTYRRKTGLAVVLTSLLGQTFTDFDVIISDQTEEDRTYLDSIEIQALVRALKWHSHRVILFRHLPRNGLAEQRQFLLEQSHGSYVHYLDDDVLLDPSVMARMVE